MVHHFSISVVDRDTGEILGSVKRNLPYEDFGRRGGNPAKEMCLRWLESCIKGRELQNRCLSLCIDIEPAHNFYVESKLPFSDVSR